MDKTHGQVAYEKWAELVCLPQLPWDQLPKSAQEGWEEVVQAVLATIFFDCDCDICGGNS